MRAPSRTGRDVHIQVPPRSPSGCRTWSCGRASATRGGDRGSCGPSLAGAAVPGARVRRQRRRRRSPAPAEPFGPATAPSSVWCIDFKGKLKTGDGEWCTPFTITDAYSRFCIRCELVEEPDALAVERILDSAFRELGLPAAIRSDNGPPFAAQGPAGLTSLAVWLLRLGLRLERITPGRPQENGRHERFHRTLADEVSSPARANARAQQRALDLFRREYNEARPHEALGQIPPADLYTASSRRYPCGLLPPTGSSFGHIERVDRHGAIRLEPDAGTRWAVLFGSILPGHIDGAKPERGLLATPRRRKSHVLQLQRA